MCESCSSSRMKDEIYILDNLHCAHCASEIEKKVQSLPEVKSAQLTFATKKIRIIPERQADFQTLVQRVCDLVEQGVTVTAVSSEDLSGNSYKAETIGQQLVQKKNSIILLAVSVAGLAAGMWMEERYPLAAVIWLGIFYLLLGRSVLTGAAAQMAKGRFFDENFLMSVATLGAFCIGAYEEALGIMLFYRIGELFEELAVERSRSQIMAAADMRPDTVHIYDDRGQLRSVAAKQIAVGDTIVVLAGERIPLDAVVKKGESRLDTSFVTGEPVPVAVSCGSSVFSGCVNTSGVLELEVTKTLEESMVSRILEAVEHAAEKKPKMDRFITRFSRVYTPVVVGAACLTAIVPSLVTGNWSYWIYTALTFLVISCPCALVLSIPLAFFAGVGAGSKAGILFKGGMSLEALAEVKAVVFDKTGTLTEGNFSVHNVETANGASRDDLLFACAVCEGRSGHPIAKSVIEYVKKCREVDADPVAELMEGVCAQEIAGKGITALYAGDRYVCGSRRLLAEERITVPVMEQSYGTEVFVAKNGICLGRVLIADTIKNDAREAVAALKNRGLDAHILTGDSMRSAVEVAERVGIDHISAGLLPENKLHKLESLRQRYPSVMFVGDGINDAPVLAAANVGAAMGSGADAALEAADVVFMNNSVNSVPHALHLASKTRMIAVENIVLALTVKIGVMALGLFGIANMWMAVFADTGVAILCIMNAVRLLYVNFTKGHIS